MPLNCDHVRTTDAGSLPRTPDPIVARQKALGIDFSDHGEYRHQMSDSVDSGAWWNCRLSRLGGVNVVPASFSHRRDRLPS